MPSPGGMVARAGGSPRPGGMVARAGGSPRPGEWAAVAGGSPRPGELVAVAGGSPRPGELVAVTGRFPSTRRIGGGGGGFPSTRRHDGIQHRVDALVRSGVLMQHRRAWRECRASRREPPRPRLRVRKERFAPRAAMSTRASVEPSLSRGASAPRSIATPHERRSIHEGVNSVSANAPAPGRKGGLRRGSPLRGLRSGRDRHFVHSARAGIATARSPLGRGSLRRESHRREGRGALCYGLE